VPDRFGSSNTAGTLPAIIGVALTGLLVQTTAEKILD